MSRILVIRGGALGDFILTLPAIRLLREAFPAAHLEILGYQHIVRLAELSGYVDGSRSIESGPLASFFARESALSPELVEYFASFQQVISYLFDPDEIFAKNLRRAGVRNLIVGSPKISGQEHAARQLARPLERLALYLEDPAARIVPNQLLKADPALVALHPGSGSATKNWPVERFVALGDRLLKSGLRLLLVGGEADEAILEEIRGLLPNEQIEPATNLPLTTLANRLQNCALFIGHDSGVSHLAAAVGTPALLLFGPTDPAIWAPQNPQVRFLRSPDLTMAGIGVEEVVRAAYELMRIGIRT